MKPSHELYVIAFESVRYRSSYNIIDKGDMS